MRYLGIDYGMKKIGLALTDETGTTAFPNAVVPNDDTLLEMVTSFIKENKVGTVVIGESRDADGRENPVAAHARAFASALGERTGCPVHFEPEHHTTQEARQLPDGTHKKGVVDASAAALILASYLERTHGILPPEPEVY